MHSSKRIIRGIEADKLPSWNIDLLGSQVVNPIERMLGLALGGAESRTSAPAIPLTEKEQALLDRERRLDEREARLEDLEREALQKAEQIGQQRGYEAGWDAAHHERVTLIQAANSIEAEFEQFKAQLGDKLLDLAVMVAKKVLGDTVQLHPEHAYLALQDILHSMDLDGKAITLMAHPQTLEVLSAQFGDTQELAGMKLMADPKQIQGGFILKHPEGEVDATLQNRWLRAIEALDRHNELKDSDLESDPDSTKDKDEDE